jgi:hypothetical protein
MVSAVILAGGSVKPDLQAQFGIPSKGMIPLLGRIAADFVVDAARACPGIGKAALAGPEAYRDLPVIERVDAFVPDTGRIPGNLLAAMVALGDSPLLTGEALGAFLNCVPEDADLCYPVVSKQGVMAAFPDREWTFIRLREGPVVCTNVLYFRAPLLKSFEALADQIEVARRKPWKLASLFGVWFLAKFLLGWMSIPAAESRLSRILGAKCCGALSDDALLAMDLDDSRDVPFVEEFLRRRAADG